MHSAPNLRDKIFSSISSLYKNQLFKFEGENSITRCEFIYLLQLINLIGQGKQFPLSSRNNWIQILREPQQPDGYFGTTPGADFAAQLALTAISIATLHQLGGDVRYPIFSARQFADRQFTENWFREIEIRFQQSSQQEQDAIASGKSVLNMFTLLDKAYCDGLLADKPLIFFFNCCDAQAKPDSGFWLADSVNLSNSNALIDALFRTQAYIFFGRYLPYPEQMIQSILKMQQRNGHFSSNPASTLISDLAAVTLLAHLYQSANFKHFWIRLACRRILKAYHTATIREIDTIFQPIPNQPIVTEALLYADKSENRLNKTVALYYFSLIQALISLILPEYKLAVTGWNLKNASPVFTFSEIS